MVNNLNIRYAMQKYRISQQRLAELLGYKSQSTISRKLNNKQLDPAEYQLIMETIKKAREE